MNLSDLLEEFRLTAAERITRINNLFLGLIDRPDPEAADAVMREIHTLKGECRIMKLRDLTQIAHRTEEVVLWARRTDFHVEPAVKELVLFGLDTLGELITALPELGNGAAAAQRFSAAVEAALGAPAGGAEGTAAAAADPPASASSSASPTIAAAGEVDRVRGKTAGDAPDRLLAAAAAWIRVDRERLDDLSEIAAELSLEKGRSRRWTRALANVLATMDSASRELRRHPAARRHGAAPLEQWLGRQEEITAALRELLDDVREGGRGSMFRVERLDQLVRGLRLQPISVLTDRYPRAVHDLAEELGKRVRLVVEGAQVELDREVLEQLADPLVHLMRNAVDHGIEPPAERLRAGKPEAGTLQLRAEARGSRVRVTLVDDGRGIDAEELRRAAVERGTPSAEAQRMDEAALLDLIFLPGFSLRHAASAVSGRGVGLDVVRKHVEVLGGTVGVETRLGAGTTFRLEVPISASLGRAMIVEAAGVKLAFASETVARAAEATAAQLERAGAGHALVFGETRAPVADLGAVLGGAPSAPVNGEARPVIALRHGDQWIAFWVDRFIGERAVIQRSPDRFLKDHRLIRGTASLDDGELLILLNVSELLSHTGGAPPMAPAAAPERRRVLVVDDSELTRDTVVGMLKAQGYEVFEAADGREALRRVQQDAPQLIVTDIEMPVLDGLGLLQELRASTSHAALPVVVLSSRGAEEDKRRAAALGADAYLVKSEFRDADLIRVVELFTSRGRG